ncbi:uncharacterized protein LOC136092013 [Hydra vulgaris]|uniref:Uncharacterized protein LOC136092013 n=1 Tax=Hydra vulgaris TaxID=6087 RepID=A0ABM4DMK5_HYDVU
MTGRKVSALISNNKSTLNKDNDVAEEKSDKNDDDISDIIATETNFENENFDNYSDLASWPDLVCAEFIDNCLTKDTSFFHNCDSNNIYLESARMYKDQKRYFSNKYFKMTLKNGQTVIRSWLCYSKLKGHMYCLVCNMFSNVSSLLATSGFSHWMNILRALESQDETVDHKNNMLIWLIRKNNINVIDKNLENISLLIENIRGQSYDNAANMSGKYSGLQARLKVINKYADFVTCAAHSLNLVGVEAVRKKDHSHIDMESINYVISFYNNDIDAGLINECTQIREYLQITNKEKQTKYSSMLKLIYE